MQEPVLVRSQDRSQCFPLRCAREPERDRERSGKCAGRAVSEGSLFFWLFFVFFFLSFLSYNALSDFRHCVLKELSCNNFNFIWIFFS